MKKTHFKSPKSSYGACGRAGDFSPDLSTITTEVTCGSCRQFMFRYGYINEIPAKEPKKSRGKPRNPKGQNQISVCLTDQAHEIYKTIDFGDRGSTLSRLIVDHIPLKKS